MSLDARLQRLWYGPAWRSMPLWPLEWIFRLLVGARRLLFRIGLLRTHAVTVPVIVVGNLTVGGTGKTPVAAWLARQFTRRARSPGTNGRRSANSIPSPRWRAAWLPAKTCVSVGRRSLRSASSRG